MKKPCKSIPRSITPCFSTALRTGMRIGELVALRPGDLDFNGGFIEIRRAFSRNRLTTPKSGKGRRVDMSKGLAETLRQHLTDRKKEALRKGWGEPPELLFYSTTGTRIDINKFGSKFFINAWKRQGCAGFRIYDLRYRPMSTWRISKGDNILGCFKAVGGYYLSLTLRLETLIRTGCLVARNRK